MDELNRSWVRSYVPLPSLCMRHGVVWSQVNVNGVVFGAGCARLDRREFCARGMSLVPAPSRQCVDETNAALSQGAAVGTCDGWASSDLRFSVT
jgi:hypothetical protein